MRVVCVRVVCAQLTLVLLVLLVEGWVEGEVGDAAVELGWRTGADGHGDRMVDSQTSPCTHRTQIS